MVQIPTPDYALRREHEGWFVVHPEHLLPEVDEVVERHETYWLVAQVTD